MKGLFWGLLTIDLHYFTHGYPEENTKSKVKRFNTYIGGPATNAALTFQHLGGKTKLVTAVGQNSFQTMIMHEIKQRQIEVIDVKADEISEPIFASIVTNISSGSRTIFSYHPQEASPPDFDQSTLQEYDIALFDGFYIETAIEQAKICKKYGITTVLDGGSWKVNTDKLLKYIDVAICSEDFVPPGITQQEDVTAYLLRKGVKHAAITRGEKPIIANEGDVNLLVEVPQVEVVDTLGAGDAFHGAFCYYYVQSRDFLDALKKATQIASYSCAFHGPRTWMEQKNKPN